MATGAINRLLNSFVFWGAWIVIPVIMEIIPAVGGFLILLRLRRQRKLRQKVPPALYPEISVIVPIYNSADTLEACLRSINDGAYPRSAIRVFLVNNLTRDNSFEIFTRCQELFPELHMQWLNAQQGKSRALNLALYNSGGKYVVHIDSDGLLEEHALINLVDLFESDLTCNCVTGTILTDPKKIQQYHGGQRLLRQLEFMEYANAFLAGRNYAGETNSIYTVSGAFSAFRKSAILKSWLYNTDTICEDTQLTFQMRYLQKERVSISVDSIFLTDPIEDLDKLYTQRQRWQRGSLEVSKIFLNTDKLNPFKIFSDVNVNTLMYDHTFAFPRMIWYLATFCMLLLGFSGKTILLATAFLFGLYTVCGFLNFFVSSFFLKPFEELHTYYRRHWWVVPLLPLFNTMVFFIRLAGVVNSIGTDSAWKTRTFTQERQDFRNTIQADFSKVSAKLAALRQSVNGDPAVMYAPKSLEQRLKGSLWGYLLFLLLFFLGALITVVVRWGSQTFNVSLNEIINTVLGPMQGTGGDTVSKALHACLPPLIAALVAAAALVFVDRFRTRRALSSPPVERQRRGKWILGLRSLGITLSCLVLAGSLVYANACYDVVGYLGSKFTISSFYEENYIDPREVTIAAPDRPKNLIYIYLESMETTYAGKDAGGFQETDLIPSLTALARENLSFSFSESPVGGFYSNYGATWTMAALYTTTSGVHYALPATDDTAAADTYASGLTTLGDVLQEAGYQNEFLCGSDINFANRGAFFRQHGDYEIFDYYTAIDRGYIPADYYEWWGFEDVKLYEYAKGELQRLSQSGQPFNLTMLTADTHFPDGYVCLRCGTDHAEKAANVVACADQQIGEFIDWCRQQSFYKDTVIVITGDHPRMDTVLVDGVDWEHRGVYNCWINADAPDPVARYDRQFTAMDIFPTILSALGFDIQGDRLGLGTDLLSSQRTLAERLGLGVIDAELMVQSNFYVEHFAPELLGLAAKSNG